MATAGQPGLAGWAPGWLPVIPALATFAVMLTGIGNSSFWEDEASTLSAAGRSFPQLLRLLRHVDTVHAAYYMLMWVVIRVAGTSETAVRLPSALAMAVAAGVIALLGRRLVSAGAGLAAGLVFAALPQVSWYGQEARGYALATALAVVASYLFVRVLDAPPAARRRWLIGYGARLDAPGLPTPPREGESTRLPKIWGEDVPPAIMGRRASNSMRSPCARPSQPPRAAVARQSRMVVAPPMRLPTSIST